MSAEMDINAAIQSLSRIMQASARLLGDIHSRRRLVDREEEVDHMQANLDHVRRLLDGAS